MEQQTKKEALLRELIEEKWLKTKRVIDAFRKVARENFVLGEYKNHAYLNEPLSIGYGQTISQPLTVAAMTEALDARKGQNVLDIGTGSGYQAAILSVLVGKRGKVVTIERKKELYESAKKNLQGYKNVTALLGDGSRHKGHYDRIIVAASAMHIPDTLMDNLKKGGKMVIPVGDVLWLVEKDDNIRKTNLGYYMFVPLIED